MRAGLLTIGELAARTNLATSALRYYDEMGLVKPTRRSGGQRRYGPDAVSKVAVIVFLRECGFTLAEVKRFFASRARSPRSWHELARRKVEELDAQITKAQVARGVIEHAMRCPKEDVLRCPTFWSTVGRVLEGVPLADAHRH